MQGGTGTHGRPSLAAFEAGLVESLAEIEEHVLGVYLVSIEDHIHDAAPVSVLDLSMRERLDKATTLQFVRGQGARASERASERE